MSQIEESVEVSVPVGSAYRGWSEWTAFPDFMSGAERECEAEITGRTPGERIAWRAVGGGAEQSGVVTFHALGTDRTRVMLQLDHTPHGVVDLIGDRLGFVAHQVHRCLRDFKQHVEDAG
ncbi:cyclase [Kitasatospora sp. NPDC049258]|uniref:SRPBCC family protein n=1 Tax=Kitasatospora sp. NPDC049258 TaxID=3155394 RepID=UPI003417D730